MFATLFEVLLIESQEEILLFRKRGGQNCEQIFVNKLTFPSFDAVVQSVAEEVLLGYVNGFLKWVWLLEGLKRGWGGAEEGPGWLHFKSPV